jgi:hypothetical protein
MSDLMGVMLSGSGKRRSYGLESASWTISDVSSECRFQTSFMTYECIKTGQQIDFICVLLTTSDKA